MVRLREVQIGALSIDRLSAVVGEKRVQSLRAVADAAQEDFAGRTIWNVNSTAVGGGVAEMLQVLLAYARGAAIDTRWLVIEGDAEFFAVTKRIHNRLHGVAGDGGPLAPAQRAVVERVSAANASALAELVRAGDVVVLHDPQTAGLVDAMGARGARVVWRCHVGADEVNGHVEDAWSFLRPYLEPAPDRVRRRGRRGRACVPPPGRLAAVNRLLHDVSLAARLGGAARSRAVEEFVGDRHLARYADLLRGLLAGAPPVSGPEPLPRPG